MNIIRSNDWIHFFLHDEYFSQYFGGFFKNPFFPFNVTHYFYLSSLKMFYYLYLKYLSAQLYLNSFR